MVLVSTFLLSGVINVLYLGGSWFMLEVYDRVLPGRSLPTLFGLLALMLFVYLFQGILEVLRSRVLVRLGSALSSALAPAVFTIATELPLKTSSSQSPTQPMRDLEQVRRFVSSPGLTALFDLPWIPVYIALAFFFHPLIGYAAICGAVVLVLATLVSDRLTLRSDRRSGPFAARRDAIAESALRNAEVTRALGMQQRLVSRWSEAQQTHLAYQQNTADISGGVGAFSKVARMALQSVVLALGAYLVISGQATAGIMIAGSILTSRALAPVELAIAHWRNFVAARTSWGRLNEHMGHLASKPPRTKLHAPCRTLMVKNLAVAAPGGDTPLIRGVGFELSAGDGLGIIGRSASGKSTLARALVGVWPAIEGSVRLDGAGLDQWPSDELGRHIGYLPQDVEIFAGTISENISRFEPDPDSTAVIEAATAAGVHDLILELPDGYDTQIGQQGAMLSAGQRQRIGLARALYRDPFLVVLDEPNSNLDAEGDTALTEAMSGVRRRGGIVIIVAHRPSALAAVNQVLVMSQGTLHTIGPKDEILAGLVRRSDDARRYGGNIVENRFAGGRNTFPDRRVS